MTEHPPDVTDTRTLGEWTLENRTEPNPRGSTIARRGPVEFPARVDLGVPRP